MSIGYGRFQKFGPRDDGGESCERTLLTATGIQVAGRNEAAFEVATPSVKCVTRIVVFIRVPESMRVDPNFRHSYNPDPGGADDDPDAFYEWPAQLFAYATTHGRGPVTPAPTRVVAGSWDSPIQVPTQPDLWGFEIVEETAGESIYGNLVVAGDPSGADELTLSQPPAGADWAVAAFYDSRVPMTEDEWKMVCGGAGVSLLKGGRLK